ncbi:hypothetical protein GSI_02197 [Ganoderma sinense ZZ0214-1]|uniref:Glycosyltransferase family 17 protein n=1 Tax=Ganoderma sinense ZZ0214-1 TaxID=1077348 RepID=A0A2G8SNZ1_9APHY|nr:hypothetical protein GSI_02197 [Ganoderma sinense ZZ0214-1]
MLVRRRSLVVFALAVSFMLIASYTVASSLRVRNFLSYSTRPLWDKPLGPQTVLPHYYAEGVPFDSHLCALHGWTARDPDELPDVWDAVLFSSELDLFEIRLHELAPVVSKFFIVEADRTFTGIPKNLTFAAHKNRFSEFSDKLVHSVFAARTLDPGESPFVNEGNQRKHMDALLRAHLVDDKAKGKMKVPPLVVFSDVDEIPSAHTVQLLRHCKATTPIHLQMREYLYSFEWPAGDGSWRAQVHQLGMPRNGGYNHGQVADLMLADAGWHCSFCFRYLREFADKMIGYSHADRVTDDSLLRLERIQQTICEGKDIFGMLPEAYKACHAIHPGVELALNVSQWKDLLALMDKDA